MHLERGDFFFPRLAWGYVDMVLAAMRFSDLCLGPYKRNSTAKPFAELRSLVMRESPSLVAPLASWGFEHPGVSTTCSQCSGPLGSCSGPCLQWSGPLGSGSDPARVPFPMLGSDTPFEFYIDNTMRGGVGGVNHEICKLVF